MAEPYKEEQFVTADTYDISAGARRLAYDPNLERLYVLGTWPEDIATISVLDASTGNLITELQVVPSIPLDIAVSSDGSTIYLAMSSSVGRVITWGPNGIIGIDTTTFQEVLNVDTGGNDFGPARIALSPDDSTAYLSHRGGNMIQVVDLNTEQLLSNINLPTVTHPDNGSSTFVAVPMGIGTDPSGDPLYVAGRWSRTLYTIDTGNYSVFGTTPLGTDFSNSTAVAVHPDGKRVYVTARNSDHVALVDVDPVSPTYHTQTAWIDVDGEKLEDMSFSASGDYLYAVSGDTNEVVIIDIDAASATYNEKVYSHLVGTDPFDIEAGLGEVAAYVTNGLEGTITVLENPITIVDNSEQQAIQVLNNLTSEDNPGNSENRRKRISHVLRKLSKKFTGE